MIGPKKRSYLTEPNFGKPRDFNASRMTQDKGRTDARSTSAERDTPTTPSKVEIRSVREAVKDLKAMGVGTQSYKDAAEQAKKDTLQRLSDKRKEREEGRSRSGREKGNTRGMSRYMAERDRKERGESRVIG